MFTGHKEITDKSVETGFETYLLLETGYGDQCEAYEIDEDTPLDLEALVSEVYSECDISFQHPPLCGSMPNYAAIITDGRTPDSVVVWQHANFCAEGAMWGY